MMELLRRVYLLNKLKTNYGHIYTDDDLTPQVKIESSSALYGVKSYTVVYYTNIQETYTKEFSARSWRLASYFVYVLRMVHPHHV